MKIEEKGQLVMKANLAGARTTCRYAKIFAPVKARALPAKTKRQAEKAKKRTVAAHCAPHVHSGLGFLWFFFFFFFWVSPLVLV
jgi:hypothetical protein